MSCCGGLNFLADGLSLFAFGTHEFVIELEIHPHARGDSEEADMVEDRLDLRAKELAPLIRELYDRNLVSEMKIGDLQTVLDELDSPPAKRAKDVPLPMTKFYKKQMRPAGTSGQASLGAGLEEILGGGGKVQDTPRISEIAGRSDPCPCGSGKNTRSAA